MAKTILGALVAFGLNLSGVANVSPVALNFDVDPRSMFRLANAFLAAALTGAAATQVGACLDTQGFPPIPESSRFSSAYFSSSSSDPKQFFEVVLEANIGTLALTRMLDQTQAWNKGRGSQACNQAFHQGIGLNWGPPSTPGRVPFPLGDVDSLKCNK